MIIPVLRVFGCAQGRDGTLAGLLVATDWDVRPEALPTLPTSSRLPSHALSPPLLTIYGNWTCFAVNCVLSSGSQSS